MAALFVRAGFVALLLPICALPAAVDYDIVYVRAPRKGDLVQSLWPEVFNPVRMEPGSDLVLLRSDGGEDTRVRDGKLVVSVKDRQGNRTTIERSFEVQRVRPKID